MFALLLNLWMCTNLDRFRMCYSKAVARMSRVVNKWLETSGRCMKTIYFHGDRLRDGNSSVMLSVAYAVWLHCCFPKNPLICFLFVAVILSSVSSSCQSGMVGLIFTSFLNFLFFKVPVRESSVNLAVILWESLAGKEEEMRSVSSPVLRFVSLLDWCNWVLWVFALILVAIWERFKKKKRGVQRS